MSDLSIIFSLGANAASRMVIDGWDIVYCVHKNKDKIENNLCFLQEYHNGTLFIVYTKIRIKLKIIIAFCRNITPNT